MGWLGIVGWAERGDGRAGGHGNSVPRFHITWGTGTGVVKPFVDAALAAVETGHVRFLHRHRVDELIRDGAAVTGVRGRILLICGLRRCGMLRSRCRGGVMRL